MELPKDEGFEQVQIKRHIEGHNDDDGSWVPGQDILIATGEGDLQPKSGRQRAAELKTNYESDHVLFIGSDDLEFEDDLEDDFEEDEQKICQGDIVIDSSEDKYTVVFPGSWGTHYQMDLKKD